MDFSAKDWVGLAGLLVATPAAIAAFRNYWHQTRTKKAEFLLALHRSFFVEESYKAMRDGIDGGSDQEMSLLVKEDSAEFTDFLNLFEIVAYIKKMKTLSGKDVEALLGYYLKQLRRSSVLRSYIAESENGFEHLDDLLGTR